VNEGSDSALEKKVTAMQFTRPQFNIRSLMGIVAVAALMVAGVVLLLRYSVATRPALPSRSGSGVIMEGVDINWRPKSERRSSPREPQPSEFPRGRQF
jgi:hypothetical protein